MGSNDHFVDINRFIVRFTKGLELLFITFLLQFFLEQMSSLSISSSATYLLYIISIL